MKIKPAFVAIAAAVVGFAFIAPTADAQPPSKYPGGHAAYIQKKKIKAERDAVRKAESGTTDVRAEAGRKTIALSVEKGGEKRKLRPYFLRKRGGPSYSRAR